MTSRDKIIADRYLQEGETEDGMYRRVAKFLANTDQELEDYYRVMSEMLFLPNTPTLVNAGSNREGGFSACYALPVEDNINGIYKTLKDMALIHKAFGGTGFNFSNLRPEGDLIKSTGGKATGPIGFIKLFDANASAIKQGGHREGANMGILNVSHPDIEKFINAEFDHFNLSVGITDEFMHAAVNGLEWPLTFGTEVYKHIDAKELFTKICKAAWTSGNPGLIFLDKLQRFNPIKGTILDTTNPCGEQMLLPYESCNLGSVNLSKMVSIDENLQPQVNWLLLEDTINISIDMLDAIISVNQYPLEEVKEKTLDTRKIGFGDMGWHDMLIMMGLPYDSQEALNLADSVQKFINDTAIQRSHKRGMEINVFPLWENSTWYDSNNPMRNASVTTIAPTGTLSIIAECSSGIEPVYEWEYIRKVESGTFVEKHPTKDLAKANGLMATAHDIDWRAHIRMQAAFQKHVHNAVSKTINMKSTCTVDDVMSAYLMAFDTGCKGITIYRDGSRDEQVLSSIDDMKNDPPLISNDSIVAPNHNDLLHIMSNRPKKIPGSTEHCVSGCGTMFITTNVVNGNPYEVFVQHSDGGCHSNMEAIGKLISLLLKEGIDKHVIYNRLSKIKCANAIKSDKSEGHSCAQIIGNQLMNVDEIEDSRRERSEGLSEIVQEYIDTKHATNMCPDCGEKLNFGEGCGRGICRGCGWSGCN